MSSLISSLATEADMKAFLTGLGVGVGLGFLFAPDTGKATRKKLRERFRAWTESWPQQAENVKTAVQPASERVSEAAANVSDKTGDHLPPKKDVKSGAATSAKDDFINTLGREELMNVNGIGPVLADHIVSGRPYSSRRELLERGILPQSTFDELERVLAQREKRSA
jgi:competence protein ComEA